jgi:hypothetical protein
VIYSNPNLNLFEVVTMRSPPPSSPHTWKDDLTMAYIGVVLAAFVLGRLHVLARRRSA